MIQITSDGQTVSQYDTNTFADKMQRLLYQLVKNYEQCDEDCVAQYGVTASQAYTLMAIPEGSPVSMNELSETMVLANSTMTRMVDNLVRKGLVYRRNDDEDRRVVRVGLTDCGREMQNTLEKEKQDLIQVVLAEISEDQRSMTLCVFEKVTSLFGKAVKACCSK